MSSLSYAKRVSAHPGQKTGCGIAGIALRSFINTSRAIECSPGTTPGSGPPLLHGPIGTVGLRGLQTEIARELIGRKGNAQ